MVQGVDVDVIIGGGVVESVAHVHIVVVSCCNRVTLTDAVHHWSLHNQPRNHISIATVVVIPNR